MTNKLNVQAGDEVVYIRDDGIRTLRKVARVTPTGLIVVQVTKIATTTFNPDGFERSTNWHRAHIQEITAELRAEVMAEMQRRKLVAQIKDVDTAGLSNDQLKRIVAIIDEGKQTT